MRCPPPLQELLETLYNLSPRETEVLTLLCDGEARIEEIAEELGKDRSTVQRYVSSLRAANLIDRRAVTTEGGKGRSYVYYVGDTDELKERIRDRLDEWEGQKLEKLDEL